MVQSNQSITFEMPAKRNRKPQVKRSNIIQPNSSAGILNGSIGQDHLSRYNRRNILRQMKEDLDKIGISVTDFDMTMTDPLQILKYLREEKRNIDRVIIIPKRFL